MMRKRGAVVGVALAMAIAALSGCKDKGNDDKYTVGDEMNTEQVQFTPKGAYGVGDAGERNKSGIKEMTYEFENGNVWSARLGEKPTVKIREANSAEYGYVEGESELDEATVAKIKEIYDEHKLWRWDGYNRRASDDSSKVYSLTIQYNDGEITKLKGGSVYPEGWSEFMADMKTWVDPIKHTIYSSISNEERLAYDDDLIETFAGAINDVLINNYYSYSFHTLKISINKEGKIKITYVDNDEEYSARRMLKNVYKNTFGFEFPEDEDPGNSLFHSKGYLNGGETNLEFNYLPSIDSWKNSVYNRIDGSKYYVTFLYDRILSEETATT